MLYEDHVTLQMKTTAYGSPMTKTMEADAELTPIGSKVQINLGLSNKDLRMHRFKIEEGSIILHSSGAYKCEEYSVTGRPHHILLLASRIE
ncbi:MAG: hypothetical protein PHX08_05665 [Lachnospiraceae bacterium]|nr:hypothetical protein [Lachnospiraceae bacterium]MDD3138442.1 hypothetical protein [Lachnospiraceae bacterium]MDD3205676.1 hypothetical protein [Lachnospiraceae bacterium]MDD3340450.1 hypothetical protein [Lachnospiraceae bacterium]MDD3416760.1 hypothetical protein [Lachnospiraceae bacterium]